MRIAFATCVQLGKSCIEEIYNVKGNLDLLITLNDTQSINKSGRVSLDDIASLKKVQLLKIGNINDDIVIETLIKMKIDWLFIIGWSQIAKARLLSTPNMGCIGMHPTLLPVGRGRAAIPWAILKGLDETGVTMFKLDQGVDTGEIIEQGLIPMTDTISATVLYNKVNDMHVQLISKSWQDIVSNKIVYKVQDESLATEWPARKPEDGEIFSDMPIEYVDRLVRAVTRPYPGAFYKQNGQVLRIWSAKFSKYSGMIPLLDGFMNPLDYEIEG